MCSYMSKTLFLFNKKKIWQSDQQPAWAESLLEHDGSKKWALISLCSYIVCLPYLFTNKDKLPEETLKILTNGKRRVTRILIMSFLKVPPRLNIQKRYSSGRRPKNPPKKIFRTSTKQQQTVLMMSNCLTKIWAT